MIFVPSLPAPSGRCGCRSPSPSARACCCFTKGRAWISASASWAKHRADRPLCPIIIYWGVNDWHSARIGLNYEFPEPPATNVRCSGRRGWSASALTSSRLSVWRFGLNIETATGEGSSVLTPATASPSQRRDHRALVTIAMWTRDVAITADNRRKPINPTATSGMARRVHGAVSLLACALLARMVQNRCPPVWSGTVSISTSAAGSCFCGLDRRSSSSEPGGCDHRGTLAAVPLRRARRFASVRPFAEPLVSLNVCFLAFGAVLALINGIGWFGQSWPT